MSHKGPYKAHIRHKATPHKPARTCTIERKTFKAAENALAAYQVNVEAKWITNAEGLVYSAFAKGEPS